MPKTTDWKNASIEDLVAEYERRKNLPTVKELYESCGLTKQGLWARIQAYYTKNPDKAPGEQRSA